MTESRFVEKLLEQFPTLIESEDIESRYLVLDLIQAFKDVELTNDEKTLIQRLYFGDPVAPERDKRDKNGNTNGRPTGGNTQTVIASEMYPGMDPQYARQKVTKTKQSALQKLAECLGEEYTIKVEG